MIGQFHTTFPFLLRWIISEVNSLRGSIDHFVSLTQLKGLLLNSTGRGKHRAKQQETSIRVIWCFSRNYFMVWWLPLLVKWGTCKTSSRVLYYHTDWHHLDMYCHVLARVSGIDHTVALNSTGENSTIVKTMWWILKRLNNLTKVEKIMISLVTECIVNKRKNDFIILQKAINLIIQQLLKQRKHCVIGIPIKRHRSYKLLLHGQHHFYETMRMELIFSTISWTVVKSFGWLVATNQSS